MESYQELRYKVNWPTWPELQNSATIVLVAAAILSIVIFVMDFVSNEGLTLYYSLF
ncbi:MAG TPA: preprotein translocase subunit SecE [Chitinophagales bacterium]|nr:preprotein translocase subunit SecE [Chitinophagales bacterium]